MSKGTITLIFIVFIVMAAGTMLIINGRGTVIVAPQVAPQDTSTDVVTSNTLATTAATTTIAISSPAAGDQWIQGGTYTVTWSGGVDDTVSVMLVASSTRITGASASKVWSADGVPNTGTYSFTVPSDISGTYQFYISDTQSYGWSDLFFIAPSAATTTPSTKQ